MTTIVARLVPPERRAAVAREEAVKGAYQSRVASRPDSSRGFALMSWGHLHGGPQTHQIVPLT